MQNYKDIIDEPALVEPCHPTQLMIQISLGSTPTYNCTPTHEHISHLNEPELPPNSFTSPTLSSTPSSSPEETSPINYVNSKPITIPIMKPHKTPDD